MGCGFESRRALKALVAQAAEQLSIPAGDDTSAALYSVNLTEGDVLTVRSEPDYAGDYRLAVKGSGHSVWVNETCLALYHRSDEQPPAPTKDEIIAPLKEGDKVRVVLDDRVIKELDSLVLCNVGLGWHDDAIISVEVIERATSSLSLPTLPGAVIRAKIREEILGGQEGYLVLGPDPKAVYRWMSTEGLCRDDHIVQVLEILYPGVEVPE